MGVLQDNAAWGAAIAALLPRPVVASPGSRNTPLVLAFAAARPQALTVVLDERAAGFFALGLGRACRQAAVLVCTSGSAAAHYLPAVVEASLSRVPLLVLTADRPPELHGCGAPQSMNQQRLFGEHVRLFADTGTPHATPLALRTLMARALDAAEGPHPGPVQINVPLREPLWAPGSDALQVSEVTPVRVWRAPPRLDRQAIAALAAQLQAVPRGLVVAGVRPPSPDDAALAAAMGAVATRLGWPVLAEPTSQLRRAAVGPALVCGYDALLRDADFAATQVPQGILRLGQAPTSKVLASYLAAHGGGRTWLIEPHGAFLDPSHGLADLVVADPLALLHALAEVLPSAPPSPWLPVWQRAEQQARAALVAACDEFGEPAVAVTTLQALPAGGALHVSSSMPVRELDSFAPPSDVAVFCSRGANGIDGTLACALGTAAAWRHGPCAVLLGDLAYLHDLGALHLARQLAVDLTAVVVNNGGGGIFDFLPIAAHADAYGRLFRTPQRADLTALAQAAGAHAVRVQDLAALRAALAASWQRPGLKVIEVVLQNDDNVARHAAAFRDVAARLKDTDARGESPRPGA